MINKLNAALLSLWLIFAPLFPVAAQVNGGVTSSGVTHPGDIAVYKSAAQIKNGSGTPLTGQCYIYTGTYPSGSWGPGTCSGGSTGPASIQVLAGAGLSGTPVTTCSSGACVFTLALGSTITAAGPIGDSAHIAQITFNAFGQLTAVSSVAIALSALGILPCGQLPVFTGDVVNSACAMTISAGAVTSTKIANGGVAAVNMAAASVNLAGATVTGTLPGTAYAQVNLAAAGNGGVGGILPFANMPTNTVRGPGSSTSGNFATYNGTAGNTVQDQAAVVTTQNASFGSGKPWCDMAAQGAVGASATVDTAAFNACLSLLSPLNGGIIFVTPNTNCYLLNAINAVAIQNISIMGASSGVSCLMANSIDSSSNWLDISGTNNWQFINVRITDNGTVVPKVGILWACTGATCGTSGVLSGLSFDHVDVQFHNSAAFLYAYGFGVIGGIAAHGNVGGGSLAISNGTWNEQHNGPATCVLATLNTCNSLIHLTALNDMTITSANATIGTAATVARGIFISNLDLVDHPSGFGGGTMDNNTTLVMVNVNQLNYQSGSQQCVCTFDEIYWSNTEGVIHNQTAFQASDGGAASVRAWSFIGDGDNGVITFQNILWSAPQFNFITIGPAIGANVGGVQYLTIIGPDVGLNSGAVPFISTYDNTSSTCGVPFTSAPWIASSNIAMTVGGNNIISCNSIDTHTILQTPGTITLVAGTDSSHHF